MSSDPPEAQSKPVRRVVYVFSADLMKLASLLPANVDRSRTVATLMHAHGLLQPFVIDAGDFRILKPTPATSSDLLTYHDREYVKYILDPANSSTASVSNTAMLDELGLSDDCPLFQHLPSYALLVAGASLTAAAALRQGVATVAINWDGGRHHAQRSKASGYCYVQDVVLAIQRLRTAKEGEKRPRIMYLDLDLHYSDAVSQAFAGSSSGNILTLSIHHHAPGFYPASPHATLTPQDTNDPFTLSIPLRRGASNSTYARIWPAVESVREAFRPEYVVVQCGVDALAGDPCKTFNLGLDRGTAGSLGWMVERILTWPCKLLFFGGGGYDSPNAARAWTYATSIIAGRPLDVLSDIPDNQHIGLYGPSFMLDVPAGNMRDENDQEHIDRILKVFDGLSTRIRAKCGG